VAPGRGLWLWAPIVGSACGLWLLWVVAPVGSGCCGLWLWVLLWALTVVLTADSGLGLWL